MPESLKLHEPVMIREVLEYLQPRDGETYIDATFGAGGYSRAILNAADCRVIAIDQDPSVKAIADKLSTEANGRFQFVAGNFGDLEDLVTDKIDGIVFDIGVSSMQIDQAERGFSFQKNGPLDMRMSSSGQTAADFLNSAGEKEIADVIYQYGEEKQSRKIAKAILAARPVNTTQELREIIHASIGNPGKTDSATKTFQALRIFINSELENLRKGLKSALEILKKGGRLVVMTFHSLEDRIVKNFFKVESGSFDSANRHAPLTAETQISNLEILTRKAVAPGEQEIRMNPRSRSAKLRAAINTTEQIGDLS
ncbi:MAG: 16S rRNA (cytosine(1402)-N(4))-methyltransferase [Alphaproteobacteria bacterium CG11_big_fil_rev_8_21_14_0_20_44_7]|nr:MAG: 16S rRNA (cytosine(1402)-N(4))-methyltransferase [Alphaproteobacteria bacterium CG11_big_fil_rev_8_21_14_0_20_44_7]